MRQIFALFQARYSRVDAPQRVAGDPGQAVPAAEDSRQECNEELFLESRVIIVIQEFRMGAGRPPLEVGKAKCVVVHVRMTQAEHRAMVAAAKRAGLSVSQFIRMKTCKGGTK